jgi:ribosome-associated translation inhibitor RaiA
LLKVASGDSRGKRPVDGLSFRSQVAVTSKQRATDDVQLMKLKWNLTAKGLRPHGQLRQKLQQKITKLELHLSHFPQDAVFLEVHIEKHPRKSLFGAGLTLRLPSNQLRAEKAAPDPVPAFDQAVKALLRELAVLKSALRRESAWKPELARSLAPG